MPTKIDFMNVFKKHGLNFIESFVHLILKKLLDRYMHGMTWRWLPIGDSFVDFVSSRDTDAWISQRELDSVKVWMESNTVFHVMRGKSLMF